MNRAQLHSYIHYACLLLVVVTLPFTIQLNSLFVILLGANWLIAGWFKKKNSRPHFKRALFLMGFFVWHVGALLYSPDLAVGNMALEKKMSLLVFPLLLATSLPLGKPRFDTLLKVFAGTCSLSTLYCLGFACYQYMRLGQTDRFFYHQLGSVIGIHAVYYALYLAFSLSIGAYFLAPRWHSFSWSIRAGWLACAGFMLLFIVLLASKMVIISLCLLANLFLLLRFARQKKVATGVLIVALVCASLLMLVTQFKYVQARFLDSMHSELSFIQKNEYSPVTPFTGLSFRLTAWKFAVEILNEKRAWAGGVGTGGGQPLLDAKYRDNHLYTGQAGTTDTGYLGYNAHNQYVETLLELGIPGVLYLLTYLFLPLYWSNSRWKYLHLAFVWLFALACLTESMLCTQKGIVFFALFQALFAFQSHHSTQVPTEGEARALSS